MLNFLFDSTQGGVSTAVNVSVTNTAAASEIAGNQIMLSVGVQPIYIRFGTVGTTAITSTTGFYLPASSMNVFSKPAGATHLHYIYAGTNSTLSIQTGNAIY